MTILNFSENVLKLSPATLYELDRRETIRERSDLPFDATWGFDSVKYAKDARAKMQLNAVADMSVGLWPAVEGSNVPWRTDDIHTALRETAPVWASLGRKTKHFKKMPPEVILGYWEIWREAAVRMIKQEEK